MVGPKELLINYSTMSKDFEPKPKDANGHCHQRYGRKKSRRKFAFSSHGIWQKIFLFVQVLTPTLVANNIKISGLQNQDLFQTRQLGSALLNANIHDDVALFIKGQPIKHLDQSNAK